MKTEQKPLTRVFDIFGEVRSPYGWMRNCVSVADALTDIEAVRKFRHGVHYMRVREIAVGGTVIWRVK